MRKNQRVFINNAYSAECIKGKSVYQVLTENGFVFTGNCGGKGICKKCYVEVAPFCSGDEENRKQTKKVLACEYMVEDDIHIYTDSNWRLNTDKMSSEDITIKQSSFERMDSKGIGVAVDVGSTTIAVSCMELETKEELTAFTFPNPQYAYGSDVISRIQFCMEKEENLTVLQDALRQELWRQLQTNLKSLFSRIQRIIYSGNTTMFHIMRGFSVNGLAQAPFTPVSLELATEEEEGIFSIFPPGFSAFAGADILTGAEYLEMGKNDSFDLLVDLGTNGELLLLNKHCGYAAATACGPVFDSVLSGAVYGSECIKAIANCVKRGLIGKDGLIAAPFFKNGISLDRNFTIRQEDIRNFQLAKGAVYAGISCLMKEAEITADDISNVYISGGLGFYLNMQDAFTVKMLPEEFSKKIHISGNSSLSGAKKLLLANQSEQQLIIENYESIRTRTITYELANLDTFQEMYLHSLNF